MAEHTVKAFGAALDEIAREVERMGGLAETAFNDSLNAVARRDPAAAQAVIERDVQIDTAQRAVEKQAIHLFVLRHPVAADLRQVVAAWKIANELERIGDLAKNIAKRSLIINQAEPVALVRSIDRMGRITSARLKQVLDSYAQRNVNAAVAVWFEDEDIDAHYNSVFRELLTYMMEDVRTIGPCAHLLFVAKNIERIGDHATNIAENIHFLVTGEELSTERPKSDLAAAELKP